MIQFYEFVGKNVENYSQHTIDIEGCIEKRSICIATFKIVSNLECSVVNVHLDEKSEETRIKQFQKIQKNLRTRPDFVAVPHILCGDFNALSQWSKNVEVARKSLGFEAPKNDLYKIMCEDYHYVDLDQSENPKNTCQYDTRVDYVFVSEALAPRLLSKELHVIPSKSDHFALLANLKFNARKILIGMTCKSNSEKIKEMALEIQQRLKDIHKVEVVHVEEDFKNISDIFQKLSKVDLVIIEGLYIDALIPSLNWIFLLKENFTSLR